MTLRQLQLTYRAITFLSWMAAGLPMSLIVLFYQGRGLDLFEVGLCFGAYSLTVLVAEIPTGGLADVVGRRISVLLAQLAVALGGLVLLFAFTLPFFLLASVLAGLGHALVSGSLEAWFVDAAKRIDPKVDIQSSFAYANVAVYGGLVLGLLTGGWLPRVFSHLPDEAEAVLSPLSTPLVAALAVRVCGIAAVALLMKEPPITDGARGLRSLLAAIRESLAIGLSRREVGLQLVAAASFGSFLALVETFWQPFFADVLGSPQDQTPRFATLFALTFVVAALSNALSVKLSYWLNKQYPLVCAVANLAQIGALLVLAQQTAFFPAAVFFLLVYFGNGLMQSPGAAYFNEKIPSERRATLISLASLSTAVGALVGNVGGGYLAKVASISLAWTLGGGLLAVSLLIYLRLWRLEVARAAEPETPGVATGVSAPSPSPRHEVETP